MRVVNLREVEGSVGESDRERQFAREWEQQRGEVRSNATGAREAIIRRAERQGRVVQSLTNLILERLDGLPDPLRRAEAVRLKGILRSHSGDVRQLTDALGQMLAEVEGGRLRLVG